jgi:Protein of unknown function (DUF4242)
VIYLVERYVPGVARTELERSLERLEEAALALQSEGADVRYLGSTIVPGDEACFCQFEAPSQKLVAEVHRRAGIEFDRIVRAVALSAAIGREGGQ